MGLFRNVCFILFWFCYIFFFLKDNNFVMENLRMEIVDIYSKFKFLFYIKVIMGIY